MMIGLASSGIAIFLFWAISYISRLLHGQYNPLTQTISRLEIGPGSTVEKAALFMVGLFIIAFTICLYAYVRPPKNKAFLVGILLFLIIGAATETIAFVPPAKEGLSRMAHFFLSGVIFSFFPIACFLQAPQYRKENWHGVFVYTLVAGSLGICFLIGYILSPKEITGLTERLVLLNGMLWYGRMGTYIIYHVLTRGFKIKAD